MDRGEHSPVIAVIVKNLFVKSFYTYKSACTIRKKSEEFFLSFERYLENLVVIPFRGTRNDVLRDTASGNTGL